MTETVNNRPRGRGNSPSTTICWGCANAVPDGKHGCPWSQDLIPVSGWTVERPKQHDYGRSYTVIDCPMYVPDSEETRADAAEQMKKTLDELARQTAEQARENKGHQVTRHWVDDYWGRDGM